MEVTGTFADARSHADGVVGLVPTMGFLHEGHISLLEAARGDCDTVTMTLYVNPLQFDEASDLQRYPRDRDRDLALAKDAGVDVVFAPGPEVMFGTEPATRVSVPPLTATMEGAHRPGHFTGVATVVAKLFAGLQPDRAYFGRKDAQQLAVVRRLAADLSFPVDVVGRPIVREGDGLALSSRNVFLDADARRAAVTLSRGLFAAADLAQDGEHRGDRLRTGVVDAIADAGGPTPEYVELASQEDVSRLDVLDRPAFLAVAARVGDVRLIDNVHLEVVPDGVTADRGVRLDQPSILYARS